MKNIKTAILLFAILMVIIGGVYPLLVTVLSNFIFPWQSRGSLIHDSGIRGSMLIGQPFSDPKYFWPRPSPTADFPYNPMASGGSQLGPTNDELAKKISERLELFRRAGIKAPIPSDLVMASGSGLDPHVTLESALIQVPRVAKSRNLDEESVRRLVMAHLEKRQLWLLGKERVNVLNLNLALDDTGGNVAHGK